MRTVVRILAVGALFFMMAGAPNGEGAKGMTIKDGSKVSFDYTLTIDGRVVDSSEGREPLTYTHGEGQIIPGLSSQLEGLKEGDEKTVVVAPEDAYGVVDPKAFQEVPKDRMPQDIDLQVGTQLQSSSPDGRTFVVTVSEVKADSVVIDLNHPLAGKTLQFQVKVRSVQ